MSNESKEQVQIGTRCSECGFKIRGLNHAEGEHHKKVIESKGGARRRAKVG